MADETVFLSNQNKIMKKKKKKGLRPTPTFLRRSPTMLRAESLAEGVREELPQPLVKAGGSNNKPISAHSAVQFPSTALKYKREIGTHLSGWWRGALCSFLQVWPGGTKRPALQNPSCRCLRWVSWVPTSCLSSAPALPAPVSGLQETRVTLVKCYFC